MNMVTIFKKREEVRIEFKEDIKKKGFPVFYYFPVEILKTKAVGQSKLYETVLERTGLKSIALYMEAWGKVAEVGQVYENAHLKATMEIV